MSKLDSGEIRRLKDSSLEHLWIYGREPSEMAEKGGPRVIVSGKGSIVRDSDGREYIDGHAGLAVRNIGYGRPEIADVVYEQMKDLSFMPWGSATIPGMQLAEKLSDITPGDLSRVFFTSGGSEANETAIKLVKSYHHRMGEPTRYRFISRQQSYHGGTFATLSLGGGVSSNEPYEPVMPGVVHVPTPDPYRCPLGGTTPYECSVRCANAVADAIKFYGPRSIAAVIAEPISASNGAAIPGDEYWPMLRDICDTNGVLLIADEVVTGFGRTGKMFACEHWGITPDIMSMGKGFTSGYLPMSGAIARKSIADVFVGSEDVTFRHIFTHGGHPACAAAALENIRIIESENLLTNSAKDVAEKRQERSRNLVSQMNAELENMNINRKYGLLGVIEYFVSETADPDFAYQLNHLKTTRIPELQKSIADTTLSQSDRNDAEVAVDRVISFTQDLENEYKGLM